MPVKFNVEDLMDQELLNWTQTLPGWCKPERAMYSYKAALETPLPVAVIIGVFGGRSLIPVAEAIRRRGGMVYAIDPMMKQHAMAQNDADQTKFWDDQPMLDYAHQEAHKAIATRGLYNHIRWVEIEEKFAEPGIGPCGFLELDGNHAEALATDCTKRWIKHVVGGGKVVLDDIEWGSVFPSREFLKTKCTEDFATETWAAFTRLHWD